LKFEGEYLYDEIIKGKIYIKGKLEYDGDFLFGKTYIMEIGMMKVEI